MIVSLAIYSADYQCHIIQIVIPSKEHDDYQTSGKISIAAQAQVPPLSRQSVFHGPCSRLRRRKNLGP